MKIPKIESVEQKEKREKRLRTIMAIIVTFILGASTAAYALMETSSVEKKIYNGFKFTQTDRGWQEKETGIVTSYLPSDVENISLSGNPKISDFSGNVYVAALSSAEINAVNELLRTMNIEKATPVCSVEYENESFCLDLPIKSCDDANQGSNVIIFESSNESSVKYSNYCLTIKGSSEDSVKSADRVIFEIYSIIS
jgi:hypothetical protein